VRDFDLSFNNERAGEDDENIRETNPNVGINEEEFDVIRQVINKNG
jgi:hypothetical protein